MHKLQTLASTLKTSVNNGHNHVMDSIGSGHMETEAGRPFTQTRQSIFDVELLCREWEITDKRVLDEVEDFIRNPPGARGRSLVGCCSVFARGSPQRTWRMKFGDCWCSLLKTMSLLMLRLVFGLSC